MSGIMVSGRELRAELAELRSALRESSLPPLDESSLRAAFRSHLQREARSRQRPQEAAAESARVARGASWRPFAAAAVVALAVIAGFVELGRVEAPDVTSSAPAAAQAPTSEALAATAFQPLLYSPGFSPSAAYSVVRVRIPLSSFAVVQGTAVDGTIEADLLVGEDGLARGIRFNPTDTLRVSATSE